MSKTKNQSRKNLWMQIVVVVVLIAFAAYFILSNVLVNKENKDLEKVVSSRTAYSFVKEGDVSFLNPAGKFITRIDVEIADNNERRATGLMFRDKMDESQGMLFLFDNEEPQSFWMKNTILPLDIIYVNSKMEIVKIQKNAVPYSEKSLPSVKPAMYVVEVNAGYCDKLGINEGDKITWRRD